MDVAVLGTGIMGEPIARNLLKAGHRVRVWNRTKEKAEALAREGAYAAPTPPEAVAGAEIVMTVLFDGDAALDVMRQAAPGLRPGALWVQSSTASPDDVDLLAGFANDNGLVYVDAPLLGTRAPAEAGQLTILAAAPDSVWGTLKPVFDAIGAQTVWMEADPGEATRLKLVVNSWVLAVNNAVGETLALAKALDVDPGQFLDAIAGGGLDMGYLRLKADVIRSGSFTPPSFTVDTAAKDARLIVHEAEQAGVRLDLAQAGLERLRRAAEQGHGGEDMAASYFASFS
ncbi:NAD(P)-dependent oxidoreductase [Actinocorallia sp. API 0066]|uniref:NAD(P)-dependent oxidoreductase n=1 Tax=Actinocorallia sp. API 0066 TaxID=2896846 RepID=UPI001E4B965A|nr:NAD(P)-dependent oxidoreductase [Actinocorallia sp. API 0066]MCD0453368.1 NAD(P)-dependent oxidoreductase [Actinocorallia sp. API 0066]